MTNTNGIWTMVERVRGASPLVHGITNYVAMDVTANALLAIGASPAMVHAEEEVADFAALADSLVINIGTLSAGWVKSMYVAARHMGERGKPWVLDPVGAGATPYRTDVARNLARLGPTVIRGNASEILAVAGVAQETRGVDSVHGSEGVVEVARQLANDLSCTVAVTGAVDYVTDGGRVVGVANGDPMMTKVTALGCAATSLVAAFLAVEDDPVDAAVAALGVLGVCGERAAAESPGPGTLRWRLLDRLHTFDREAAAAVRLAGPPSSAGRQ